MEARSWELSCITLNPFQDRKALLNVSPYTLTPPRYSKSSLGFPGILAPIYHESTVGYKVWSPIFLTSAYQSSAAFAWASTEETPSARIFSRAAAIQST